MATYERQSGIRLVMPDTYDMEDERPARRGARPRAMDDPPGDEHSAMMESLAGQGMELMDEVSFMAAEPPRPRGARPGVQGQEDVMLEVPMGSSDAMVVLAEQEGVYSWVMPEPESGARGGRPGARQCRFKLQIGEGSRSRGARARGGFGFLGMVRNFVSGRIRTYVMRFAAIATVEGFKRLQERNIEQILVVMDTADDANAWRGIERLGELGLPVDRAPRLLLFVHGTFSSTVGSFGALASTPEGQDLLRMAGGRYDAVIGYDHRTLSLDPRENAQDLVSRLGGLALAPRVDAVAFSRGGLVLRSLLEDLLPGSGLQAEVGRAIFVACTHAGTELGRPENWHALVDLYTNLVLAASRFIGRLPQARAVTEVVAEGVQFLGDFVKYLADTVATERRIPGLSAMVPGSEQILALAGLEPGHLQDGSYRLVTSDFNVSLARAGGGSLPRRLLTILADSVTDRLMGVDNDLVVDVASMGAVAEDLIGDRLDLGNNPDIFHTIYFGDPAVTRRMAGWLEL